MSTEQTLVTDALKNAIDSTWNWLREHDGFWRHSAAGVEICVEPGVADTVQNALLRAAPDRSQGTYAIEVDVFNHALPTQQYEQAGITSLLVLLGGQRVVEDIDLDGIGAL